MNRTVFIRLPLMILLAFAPMFIVSSRASATPPAHAHSQAEYAGNNTGFKATWSRGNFNLGGAGDYSYGQAYTHEIWDVNSSGSQWVEIGLVNADDWATGWGGNPHCSTECTAYQWFWADSDSTGHFFFHSIANLSPGPNSDAYGIVSENNAQHWWDPVIDFIKMGTSTNQTTSTDSYAIAGQEIDELAGAFGPDGDEITPDGRTSGSDPDNNSVTFVQTAQVLVNGTWQTEPWSVFVQNYPCGTPVPPKWPSGYCLNGATFGAGNWETNLG